MRDDVRRYLNGPPRLGTVKHPAILEARDRLDRLAGAYREAVAEESEAKTALHQARELDREAFAEAVAEDKADPGARNADKAGKARDNATRRREGTELAVERAFDDLVAAVERHAVEEREANLPLIEEARSAARDAVVEAIALIARLGELEAANRELGTFPGKGGASVRYAEGLPRPNGDAYTVGHALAEVRSALEPPVPAPTPAVRPLTPIGGAPVASSPVGGSPVPGGLFVDPAAGDAEE